MKRPKGNQRARQEHTRVSRKGTANHRGVLHSTSSSCDDKSRYRIEQRLDAIVLSRLFGGRRWLADPNECEVLQRFLHDLGLEEPVIGTDQIRSTELGKVLNVDLMQVFLGLWDPWEVPGMLLHHSLISDANAQELLRRLGTGWDPERALKPQVKQACLTHYNRRADSVALFRRSIGSSRHRDQLGSMRGWSSYACNKPHQGADEAPESSIEGRTINTKKDESIANPHVAVKGPMCAVYLVEDDMTAIAPDGVTGRDGYVIQKALVYAIEAIESLPPEHQEWSDCQDMKCILKSVMSEGQIHCERILALGHLRKCGYECRNDAPALKDGFVPGPFADEKQR
jgi:hypothetical protein